MAWTGLALGLPLVVACGDGDLPSEPVDELDVTSVTPAANAVAAPRTGDLLIRFDRPLASAGPAGIDLRVFGRWSGVARPTLSLEDGGLALRASFARPFASGETVTVTLVAGTYRAADGRVGRGHTWSFWTAPSPGALVPELEASLPVRRPGEERIQTYGAYAGDLDGDGWSDLVLPNERSSDLRIFLNDGGGGYGPFQIVEVPGGDDPSTNEGADLDGDGDIDFVVGSARGRLVAVYHGDGAGGLAHVQNLDAGPGVRGVCLLDFENDGDPDLVAAAFGADHVALFTNDGRGGFSRSGTLDVGGGEWSCAPGDVDGDGLPDAFIGTRRSNEVVVLRSLGDGTFEVSGRADAGGDPWMLASGDVDGDGRVDAVAVNHADPSLALLVGDGRGGLDRFERHPFGGAPLAVDLGDLDGDGDLDVVTSDFATARFDLFENAGGSLVRRAEQLAAPAAASCAILHDRDNDGDLDVSAIDEVDDVLLLFENRG